MNGLSDEDYFSAFRDLSHDDVELMISTGLDSRKEYENNGEVTLLRDKIKRLENEKVELLLHHSQREREIKSSFQMVQAELESKINSLKHEIRFRVKICPLYLGVGV